MRFREWGNQHRSMKRELLSILHRARAALDQRNVDMARNCLDYWECLMTNVPASTRRRWKCGR